MRKLIFLLMAVTLPLFVSEMGAEEIEVKEIPLEKKVQGLCLISRWKVRYIVVLGRWMNLCLI